MGIEVVGGMVLNGVQMVAIRIGATGLTVLRPAK